MSKEEVKEMIEEVIHDVRSTFKGKRNDPLLGYIVFLFNEYLKAREVK
ncbi:MAG TPA: hypothetical protein PL042_04795 [Caldisericia bacterium]|jgi:maltose-binding protein MalE|nr:hypothetical protein [Caldisericia bacterium]